MLGSVTSTFSSPTVTIGSSPVDGSARFWDTGGGCGGEGGEGGQDVEGMFEGKSSEGNPCLCPASKHHSL